MSDYDLWRLADPDDFPWREAPPEPEEPDDDDSLEPDPDADWLV